VKSKYDRVNVPRAYIVQYLKKRGEVYPEDFVEAVVYFLDGRHTLRETRETRDFGESDKTFYSLVRTIRNNYIRDSRRLPASVLHQTNAM